MMLARKAMGVKDRHIHNPACFNVLDSRKTLSMVDESMEQEVGGGDGCGMEREMAETPKQLQSDN